MVSARRLNKFLKGHELDDESITSKPGSQEAIRVENGTFSWSRAEKEILTEISFNVGRGKLVAIVGAIGTGKSSVLAALLGDMEKISGSVEVNGSVAYVPQQAW